MRVLKFLVAGGIGVSVNLELFHLLYVAGVPYLVGSTIALLVSMVVGFFLQKYWTFENRALSGTHVQFVLYTALAFSNFAINTVIVYVLIGNLEVFYLLSQAIAAAIVATYSFFVYHLFIFKQHDAGGKLVEL